MAIRLGEHVREGTIDNSMKGRVRGRLYLVGRDNPIELDLEGNAHLDLAGRVLRFRNPAAVPVDGEIAEFLEDKQAGFVGDMTASKRSQVMEAHGGGSQSTGEGRAGENPCKPVLFLEWFGHSNGRIVIEELDCEWEADDPRWELNDDEIGKQVGQARAARELHLNLALELFQETNQEIRAAEREIDPNATDEFTWEKRLQESDRRSEAFHALLEEASNPEEMERLADLAFSDEYSDEGEVEEGDFEPEGGADWSDQQRDLYKTSEEASRICGEIRSLSKALISDRYDELLVTVAHGDFLALVVKAQTAADLVERGEGTFERGFLIAHVKREIARSQHLLGQLQNEPEEVRHEIIDEIWTLRDRLVDLAGQLRGENPFPF